MFRTHGLIFSQSKDHRMPNLFKKLNQIKTIILQKEEHSSQPETETKSKPKIKTKPKTKKKTQTKSKPNETITQKATWVERRNEDVLYTGRPLALVGFPMSKPKSRPDSMHLVFKRTNGTFTLRITADPEFGMPFGQDQLFLLTIMDYAFKTGSQKVDIGSIYRMLKALGMPTGGSKYHLIQKTILRVFGSVATCWWTDGNGVTGKKFDYFREIHLEVLKKKYTYNSENGDYIVLSDELFKDLKNHPIPYDLEILRQLKSSPGATRLYLWLAPRAFRVQSPQGITYLDFKELANEIGADAQINPRKFKQNLKSWIKRLDKELLATRGIKIPLRIEGDKAVVSKASLVPGAHRKKALPDSNQTPQENPLKSEKQTKPKKIKPSEFDIDWVIEKEIQEFRAGLKTSISAQANAYMKLKKEIFKGTYESEDELFSATN